MRTGSAILGLITAGLVSVMGERWVQVWSDEFNGGSVDRNKWHYEIGGGGWGNNEMEYYTDRT